MKISAQHVFKSKAQPKQGHLLLADPHLTEAFFERAVILLVAHDQSESFGLVLNHKSELVLSDLFEHIELDLPIFNGGPVAPEQLFYLQARGITEGEARRLVVRGFLNEVVQQLGVPALAERIEASLNAELEAGVK